MGNLGKPFNKRNGKPKVWQKKLFELRKKILDLSQDDFAHITFYNKRQISRYETGETKISNNTIENFIRYLDPDSISQRISKSHPDNELIRIIKDYPPNKNLLQIIGGLDIEKFFSLDQPSSVYAVPQRSYCLEEVNGRRIVRSYPPMRINVQGRARNTYNCLCHGTAITRRCGIPGFC